MDKLKTRETLGTKLVKRRVSVGIGNIDYNLPLEKVRKKERTMEQHSF